MGRRSSIYKLPADVQRELDDLILARKLTYTQITDHLRSLGVSVGRSAVAAYGKGLDELARTVRDTRIAAKAVSEELIDSPEQPVGRLVTAHLECLLLKAQKQLVDEDGTVDIKGVGQLSTAIRDLQSALKSNVDTELKIRKAVQDARSQAADEVERTPGLTQETREDIKARILGIGRPA